MSLDIERAALAPAAANAPYQPPAVLWDESIDQGAMLAAACGKNEGFPSLQCESAPAS
jgi:hypothetical protein